jgi:transcriptional regulator with XRE-family HTH domain
LRYRLPDVPRRLKAFREAADLTQDALAKRAGVAAKYISEIENGHANPTIGLLARLVELGLGVPLAAFFGADVPDEIRDDMTRLDALFAAQPAAVRRRALKILKALCED